jgi:hypothetical protein
MPVNIKSGETEDQFIGRCMSIENESFPDEAQRYAVCKSIWDRGKMKSAKGTAQKVKLKYDYIQNFKGINLEEGGLENACWEGYVAIGTKELNGREVPNCVPVE